MSDVIIEDKIYVLKKMVRTAVLPDVFEVQAFNEKACQTCEYKPDRPCVTCDNCAAYGGHFKFWTEVTIEDKPYIGFPLGDRRSLRKVVPRLQHLEKLDQRSKPKLSFKLALGDDPAKQPRPDQQQAVADMIAKGYGILKAPPRSGKTVMGVMITIKHGLKTLILAHQEDLLKQFLATFYEFSDVAEHEERKGKKLVGLCVKEADFDKYEICLSTYQMFISAGGKKRLNRIKDKFGTVITDEVHRGAAACYSKVLTSINSRYRYGLTATPTRKDGMDFVVDKIIGPVVHEATVATLIPTVKLIPTGIRPKHDYKVWVYAMRFLQDNEERNALIVKHAVHDLKRGRSILIPVTLKKHTQLLVDAINAKMGKSKKLAAPFNGGLNKTARVKVLEDAKSGKVRCVVAMRSMLTGINIPRWDALYEIMPISNPPNFHQETARIRTPLAGKNNPYIKFFLDVEWGLSRGCFMTCLQTFQQEKMPFTTGSKEVLGRVFQIQNRKFGGYGKEASIMDAEVSRSSYKDSEARKKSTTHDVLKARFKSNRSL